MRRLKIINFMLLSLILFSANSYASWTFKWEYGIGGKGHTVGYGIPGYQNYPSFPNYSDQDYLKIRSTPAFRNRPGQRYFSTKEECEAARELIIKEIRSLEISRYRRWYVGPCESSDDTQVSSDSEAAKAKAEVVTKAGEKIEEIPNPAEKKAEEEHKKLQRVFDRGSLPGELEKQMQVRYQDRLLAESQKQKEKNAQAALAKTRQELMPTPVPAPLTPAGEWRAEPPSEKMLDTTSPYFSTAKDHIQSAKKSTEKALERIMQEIPTEYAPAFLISKASAYGVPAARIVKNVGKAYEYVGERLNEAIDIVTTGDMSIEEAEQWGPETERKFIAIYFNYGGPAEPIRSILKALETGDLQKGLEESFPGSIIAKIRDGKPWLTVPITRFWHREKK